MARIGALDGLRGGAALWVLVGHAALLTGTKIPIVVQADLAVDLFMMLSGFLMCFHYLERREREAWEQSSTWLTFWTRRFFRIAPVYYLALIAAFLSGPTLGHFREVIAQYVPGSQTEAMRYYDVGVANFLTHASFVFGLSPHYGYRTALPDWSIGLEMAFYAAFPFVMILAGRFSMIATAIAGTILCLAASWTFPDFFGAFRQPSFLLIKLPVFFAGMLIAVSLSAPRRQIYLLIAVALCLVAVPIHPIGFSLSKMAIRIACLLGLIAMTNAALFPEAFFLRRMMFWTSDLLGNKLAGFLGDTSYSVYLLHLLIMLPTAALVLPLVGDHKWAAFLTVCFIVCVLVYSTAWFLHCFVEKPGIDVGRKVVQRFRRPLPAISMPPG